MIINFSVQNFGSIKDKQTLSFEADKSKRLEDHYVVNIGGMRLLKLGLIYGANASGKTTILKALDFLRDLVLEPETKKTDTINFKPFLFDANTPHQNTIFSISFFKNEVRYFYEVELNHKAIVKEELFQYKSKTKKDSIFIRNTDVVKQLSEINFSSKKDKGLERAIKSNTLWNNTVFGGFLKTNVESDVLSNIVSWFANNLMDLIYTKTDLDGFVNNQIDESEIDKKDIVNILKKADFNISGLELRKADAKMSDKFFEFVKIVDKDISDEMLDNMKESRYTSFKLSFEHTVDNAKYLLPIELESQGTQRYYGFAGILSLMIRKSIVVSIDELESSLHPDLFNHFLLSFLMNSKESQLIATTHNREVLNNKDIFRNDAIWITDKSQNSATHLYSIADFDSSVIRDSSNILNAYKVGKLGGVPNLGDYYINLDA